MLKQKFSCGECNKTYKEKEGAVKCWAKCMEPNAEISNVWVCPVCETEWKWKPNALDCCDTNK